MAHQEKLSLFDAWMRELDEAKFLAEEIESHINANSRGDSYSLVGMGSGSPRYAPHQRQPPDIHTNEVLARTRQKLRVLATKVDRLESLLHNPPAKPILSERDLHNRKDMILDMRQQMKQMAICLCTSPKKNAQVENDNLQLLDAEKATNPNNESIDCLKSQNTKDKEPVCSKAIESDKKLTVITVEEKSNLQSPLLSALDKDTDGNQSSGEEAEKGFLMCRCFSSCQSIINLLLTTVAIVVLILIIMAVFKTL